MFRQYDNEDRDRPGVEERPATAADHRRMVVFGLVLAAVVVLVVLVRWLQYAPR